MSSETGLTSPWHLGKQHGADCWPWSSWEASGSFRWAWLQTLPRSQSNLFKPELEFTPWPGSGQGPGGREANICKRYERKLFHNVYRLASQCCLGHIRLLHEHFKAGFGCWSSTFTARERKSRHGSSGLSDGGIYHFLRSVSRKAHFLKANAKVSNHSALEECLIIHSLSNATRASLLWLLNY